MRDKKIVFFDIDGTIYSYGKYVPDDTKAAIRKLRENGHYALLCTGRTKNMVFPEIYDIGFDGMIGGAGTYVEFEGNILSMYHLPKEYSDEIIRDMLDSKIFPIPEGIDNIYFDVSNVPEEYMPIYHLYVSKVPEYVKDIHTSDNIIVSKLSGRLADEELGESFIRKYSKDFNIVEHGKNYIEMIPKGYSKAVGIEKLITKLDIPIENTYAFGDGMNDYEMLQYVKYGIAMGNASKEFKSMMEYVTDDFDKGGISNALMKFGLIDSI